MTARRRLPAHRPAVTLDGEHGGIAYAVTIGCLASIVGALVDLLAREAVQ